ncbi:sensor histidine kinase [Asticcacaulis sp. AC466]|uniref:sensor histidine kinase n=1 Tax=Asticcacaulis sp. AC466 TaxID=1282362 RepID=UPI001F3A9A92|nr:sensor histidine kinase [Asticcacaulis sp. AC466]
MTMPPHASPALTRVFTIAGIWLIIGLVMGGQWYVNDLAYDAAKPWWVYCAALVASMLWAAMTPMVFALAGRIGFERGRALRCIGLHIVTGLLLSVAHTLVYVFILSLIFGSGENMLWRKMAGSLQGNLLTYATLTGIVIAGRAYRRLTVHELDAARLQTQLAEAQTAALRAQLQPHFLFNALNAISALVRSEPLKAERMIARLGDLLRLSIHGHRGAQTTLGDELDFTDAYLAIEEARLGERLTLVRDIAPDALSAVLPSLLLQPLVENAVRHGIAPLPEGGTITLMARIAEGHLHLTVRDDGAGAGVVREGVGLTNSRRRLERLCDGGFDIVTAPGRGFRIDVRIPQGAVA